MKKILKYMGLLILPIALAVSCENEPVYPDTSQYKTEITSIKIVNGGLSGTETIVGTVNENKKEISFPEVHKDSDLSKVKFEITATDDRAQLDSLEYNFVVAEGYSEKVRTIKIVNSTRFREYYVTIRLDLPVWGADFTQSKVKVYDYTPAALPEGTYAEGSIDKPVYNTDAAYGRQYGISLDNVLIVNRVASGPGLVKLSDIKEGNIGNFTPLAGSEAAADVWNTCGGVISNGHVYISNGTPWHATLSIRCWEENEPATNPVVMKYDYPVTPRRYDGVLSGNIDATGNGYFFISGNTNVPQEEKLARFSVTGFSTLSKVDLLPAPSTQVPGSWATFNNVPGKDEYLYSGYNPNQCPTRLMSSSGSLLYTIPIATFPQTSAVANVVVFNQERYLMVMDQVKGLFSVYDITMGASTQEALESMSTRALLTYELGAVPSTNASMTTDWVADGDDTLYLIAGGVQAGFVVFEIPKKVKE